MILFLVFLSLMNVYFQSWRMQNLILYYYIFCLNFIYISLDLYVTLLSVL